MSGEEIADTIESVGGRIGVDSGNNSSSIDIAVQQKDFELGLKLLADITNNPSFPEDEMEKTRAKIIADIKAEDEELIYLARKLFMKTMFKKHPYRLPVSGSIESVESISRDQLTASHAKFYVPNNMALSIFGDVDTDKVLEQVKRVWGELKVKEISDEDIAQEEPLNEIRTAVLAADKMQTVLFLGYPGIDIAHEDRFAFRVLTYVLSGQGSRIFDNLREKQGLAYYAGAFMFTGIDAGAYIFYVGTTADKADAARQGLLDEIDKLRRELVTEDELYLAKENIIGNQLINRQQNQAFAEEVSINELLGLGYEEIDRFEDGIRKITVHDIQRIAGKYFTPDAYVSVTVGNLP